ncbi:MAF protein [Frischella perrara]|uniref:Nucleoside triphosphate pyrophosphatase n=1 Tax=Frischella perrara TaxID=1267021 RepID=A0A0A7S5L8_FRIPE|nr:Maf family protein [Frischella perrara]AJA44556.1 MAF protein [Frischella perrara]PWV65122.1 MAF protein [Frischella perrara]
MTNIILASTSESRKKVLRKFALPFDCIAPTCDETPLPHEKAIDLVLRLSQTKAQSVAKDHPNSIVIGSDQVGVMEGKIIGKPYTREKAIHQLLDSSGKTIKFFTGLSVIHGRTQQNITTYEQFDVTFRSLTLAEITAYVKKEQPLQCAGSFKCDELGITLFSKLEGKDINSLVGLPLIRLNQIMIDMGFNPLLMSC